MIQTVLILCGGKSPEHEISLISAKCILEALDRKKFTPLLVGISKKGQWFLEEEDSFFQGELKADSIQLNENRPEVSVSPYLSDSGRGQLFCEGQKLFFDVAFPILHGPFGEDGTIQGLFDLIGVPYVGSQCSSSAICMDKVLTKQVASLAGIAVVESVVLRSLSDLAKYSDEITRLGFPLFIKPARMGSSVGVSKVKQASELHPAVKKAMEIDSKVLIEKGVGGREIECAVLGTGTEAQVAIPGEVVPHPEVGWYSYDAKYLMAEGAKVVIPAPLSSDKLSELKECALKVFRALECSGLARIDFFVDHQTQKIFLNEVNTMPGFTPISMYPKMWQASGKSYGDLLTEVISFARMKK